METSAQNGPQALPVEVVAGEAMTMLEAALAYGRAGWKVIPCHASGPKAKHPKVAGWQKSATADEDKIRAWWTQWPDAAIGLPMGQGGVVAVDCDLDEAGRPAGAQELACFLDGIADFAVATAWQTTPSGGMQALFRLADGMDMQDVKNAVGRTGWPELPHCDVRASGGFIIAAPSRIGPYRKAPQGGSYAWQDGIQFPQTMPEPLYSALPKRSAPKAPALPVEERPAAVRTETAAERKRRMAYAMKAIEDEVQALAQTQEGGRNNALNASALRAFRLAMAGGVDAGLVVQMLHGACRMNGYLQDPQGGERGFGLTVRSAERKAEQEGPAIIPYALPRDGRQAPAPSGEAVPQQNGQQEARPAPMQFLTRAQARAMKVEGHKVEGLLPNSGVGQIYGDSGCGKSFTLMQLCHCLSEGWPFCGRAVKRCAVYYFHLEGVGGLPKRLAAFDRWMEEAGKTFDGQGKLYYRTADFSIDAPDMASLAQTILDNGDAGALVVIDTQAQATAGKDENSSLDMGLMLKEARSLAKAVNGIVLLVHHTGKDATKGGRGSSVQRADFDFQIEVARDKGGDRLIYWNSAKERDDDDGQQFRFKLKVYENVLQDEDGKWQSSCVAVPVDALSEEERAELKTGRLPKLPDGLVLAVQALEEALLEERKENPQAVGVPERRFREVFRRRYPNSTDDPDKAREAKERQFRRYREAMLAKGLATMEDGVWALYRPTVGGTDPASK